MPSRPGSTRRRASAGSSFRSVSSVRARSPGCARPTRLKRCGGASRDPSCVLRILREEPQGGGGRVNPLVVIDADVLGRHRTGDETYVRNLLRELALLAPDSGLRFAAVTRRPDLVPEGIEAVELAARSQELRM